MFPDNGTDCKSTIVVRIFPRIESNHNRHRHTFARCGIRRNNHRQSHILMLEFGNLTRSFSGIW
jgi:hypothetical protein